MLLAILVFILLLGLLVLAHEFGHFIVARKLGVRIEEFAFGFPPRLVSFRRGGTRFALNLIPIGGYVRIFGEGGEEESHPESFSGRPVGQRFAIIAAGVAMNVVLAWLLFSVGHGLGLPTVVGEGEAERAAVTIIGVAPGSPAERSGLRFGDAIREIRSTKADVRGIERVEDVQTFVAAHRGQALAIAVRRGGEELILAVVPRPEPPPDQGPLGIALARVGVVRSPWWRAPWDGLRTTASAVAATGRALAGVVGELVRHGRIAAEVSGPVGIFSIAAESQRLGLSYLLELAGVLSVNLALLNVLPVPALDGGRMLFLAVEKIRGVRFSQRLEQAAHTVGLALLLTLMALLTYRDLVRFF